MYIVAIDKTENYNRVRFLYKRDRLVLCKKPFFHEDEDYVWIYNVPRNKFFNGYTNRFFRLSKNGSGFTTAGYPNHYSHNNAMLFKNDDYFVYSQSIWNFSSSRPKGLELKMNFCDTKLIIHGMLIVIQEIITQATIYFVSMFLQMQVDIQPSNDL